MATNPADRPAGIKPTDALTRCLTILDKVESGEDDGFSGERSPVARVVLAIAAFYEVTLPADEPEPD